MKIIQSLFFIALVSIIASSFWSLRAKIGCKDDANGVNIHGYQRYAYVACDCPCEQYPQSYNRGRCSRCWHFHDPETLPLITNEHTRPCNISRQCITKK